jgi:hypothetical protein
VGQSSHIKFLSGKLNRNLLAIYIAVGSGTPNSTTVKRLVLLFYSCFCVLVFKNASYMFVWN